MRLPTSGHPTIGVRTTASRQRARVFDGADNIFSGPWTQVSRLGNPLINEVIIPLGEKDHWNRSQPVHDKQFATYYAHPALPALLPVLYPFLSPGMPVFPDLAALVKAGTARADLEAILLTGIPSGLIPGFTNYTGAVQADMLRLNTKIPPTSTSAKNYSILGLIGGGPGGFPHRRPVADDGGNNEPRARAPVGV